MVSKGNSQSIQLQFIPFLLNSIVDSIDSIIDNCLLISECYFETFQALSLPATHQKGKLLALRLLCSLIVRPHDLPLPRNQLLQFYRTAHNGLIGEDQVVHSIISSIELLLRGNG